MTSYIFRKIDDELWRLVKAKAALHRISIKALIESLLRDWLKTPDPPASS